MVKVFIGGLFGPSYEVFSDGVTLRYKTADGMLELEKTSGVRLTPSLQQWKQFRQALDQAGAWKWEGRYVREDIHDGTSWYVVVADGPNRTISSYGGNAYPEGFEEVLAATRALIGGGDFR